MQRGHLLLTLLLLFSWTPSLRAATDCENADTISKNVVTQGWTLSCCHPESLLCRVQSSGACNAVLVAYCLGAGSAQVCRTMAVSPGSPTIVLCTVHSGPTGSTFGISPVSTEFIVPLLNADVQEQVQKNWHAFSSSDQAVLCSTGLTHLPSGSRLATWQDLNPPVCGTGEYTLRCLGTAAQGLCTVYHTDADGIMNEIGQHYFVNFDKSLPAALTAQAPSQSPGPGSIAPGASETTAPASSSPQVKGNSASKPATRTSHINPAVIAVPIAAVVLVMAALATFFCLRRHRAARESVSPYVRHHLTGHDAADSSKVSLWHTLFTQGCEQLPSPQSDSSQGPGKSPTQTDGGGSANQQAHLPPYSPS